MADLDNTSGFSGDNPWYPRHVSDRADELIDELDAVLLRQLWGALKRVTLYQWTVWLEASRDDIRAYDALSSAARRRVLTKVENEQALRLHHACVFVELWRARLVQQYFPLPPNGLPLDNPTAHREMLLSVLAAYNAFVQGDVWPFAHPEGEEGLPFAESEAAAE